MVRAILAKYGLMFHVALLCAASCVAIFLPPFYSASMIFWLAILVLEWMLLMPSVRKGETMHDARIRVLMGIFTDPVFYVGVLFSIITFLQWWNGGLEPLYNLEKNTWIMKEPEAAWLPSVVDTRVGWNIFIFSIIGTIVAVVLRAVPGRAARRWVILAIPSFIGFVAFVAVLFVYFGNEQMTRLAMVVPSDGWAWGSIFGCALIISLAAAVDAANAQEPAAGWLSIFAITCNVVGLCVFSTLPAMLLYGGVAILFSFYLIAYTVRTVPSGAMQVKILVAGIVLIALGVALALAVMPAEVESVKLAAMQPASWWEQYGAQRAVLTRLARGMWLERPWCGVGVEGFRHFLSFSATPEDWRVISDAQPYVMNGWVQALCEFGLAGVGLIVAALCIFLFSFIRHFVVAWRIRHMDADTPSFAFFLPATVWAAFLVILILFVENFFSSPFASPALIIFLCSVFSIIPVTMPGLAIVNRKRKERFDEDIKSAREELES